VEEKIADSQNATTKSTIKEEVWSHPIKKGRVKAIGQCHPYGVRWFKVGWMVNCWRGGGEGKQKERGWKGVWSERGTDWACKKNWSVGNVERMNKGVAGVTV